MKEEKPTKGDEIENIQIVVGEAQLLVPRALLNAASLIHFCQGCVEAIEYRGDGTVGAIRIKWTKECGDHAAGTTTRFAFPEGAKTVARAAERAQDNCLEVEICFDEGTSGADLLNMTTKPKNGECCPKASPPKKKFY